MARVAIVHSLVLLSCGPVFTQGPRNTLRPAAPVTSPAPIRQPTHWVWSDAPRVFDIRSNSGFPSGWNSSGWYGFGASAELSPPGSAVFAEPLQGAGGGEIQTPRSVEAVARLTLEFPIEAQVSVGGN